MEYYDEELKRTFDIPFYENVSEDTLFNDFADEVFESMFNSIKTIVNENLEQVPCMVINDTVLSTHKDTLIENLEASMTHYTEIEDYEKCIKLQKLKEQFEKDITK